MNEQFSLYLHVFAYQPVLRIRTIFYRIRIQIRLSKTSGSGS
jgi:hypothetical protein